MTYDKSKFEAQKVRQLNYKLRSYVTVFSEANNRNLITRAKELASDLEEISEEHKPDIDRGALCNLVHLFIKQPELLANDDVRNFLKIAMPDGAWENTETKDYVTGHLKNKLVRPSGMTNRMVKKV